MHSVRRTGCLAAVILALVALAPACGREASTEIQTEVTQVPEPAVVVAPPPLEVEFAGCAGGEKQANTCMLGEDRALSLWVKGEPATVFVDATVVKATATEEIDGGWRSTVRIPAGGKELRVERGTATPWTLGLVERPPTPILDRIRKTLPEQNDPKRTPGAEAGLKAIEAELGKMGAFERAEALRLATVLTWDVGRDGSGYGRRALAAAMEYGDPGMILDRASVLVYMLGPGSKDASWVVDLATLYSDNVADGLRILRWQIHIADYEFEVGETGRGLESLRICERMARRLGFREDESSAGARLAGELGTYGLEAERAVVVERLVARSSASTPDTVCLDATALANLGSSLLYAKMTADGGLDPEPLLRRSIAKFETDAVRCEAGENADWKYNLAFAHTNLVLSAVLDRRWEDVDARLRWFDGRRVGDLATSVALSRVQLALSRGDVRAARRLLPRSGHRRLLVEWRRAMVTAQVHEAAGDRKAALASFLEAEEVVGRMMNSVGAGEVRSGSALGLRAGAAHAIRLLDADRRTHDAAIVARNSRVRALRPVGRAARLASMSAAQRREWSAAIGAYESARDKVADNLTRAWLVPADERASMLSDETGLRDAMHAAYTRAFEVLAKVEIAERAPRMPPSGDLWLVFHPRVDAPDGWYGIASTATASVVRSISLPKEGSPPEELSEALLQPFSAEIDAARSISVLPSGPLLDVPFHELPWRGEPLIAHAPVLWAADFDASRTDAPPSLRALVVGDPETRLAGIGRLPRARAEAEAVSAALGARGFSSNVLVGAEATLAGVLGGLHGAQWFHFAGHGLANSSDPWDSALPLAGEAVLTARDILALPEVPHTVVLSGCETAATRSGEALSLATTFVLAGASTVVGSTTDLGDDDAADMAETLYRHAQVGDGAAWFRAAVLDGRARGRAWTTGLRIWSP